MRRLWLLFVLLWPSWALSQSAATLVADSVILNDQDQLIAEGNIEVIYQDNILRAARITYEQSGDRLQIDGPITIQTADGTFLTATQATLDPQLQNGVLQGARIVLDQKLQIAAAQIDRRGGRFSQLYRSVASSCQVCGDRPPLWDIRAERVVHDQVEQQLYFENAIFRVRGIPIAWVPRMRLPDPNLERSTGFLIPSQRNTTQLGTGVKIPYFITIGDDKDLTLTPYVSPETRTLEVIYRQAFVSGALRVEGAVTEDTLEGDRSYVFAEGQFALPDHVQLSFDIETTSDPAYLAEYGYSDKDRLDSAIGLLRVRDASLAQANLTYFQTLRDDEENDSLPPVILDFGYEGRAQPHFGGVLRYAITADSAYRSGDGDGDLGRDVTRAGVQADWARDWLTETGVVLTAQTDVRADLYYVQDDADFDQNGLRIVPTVGATLRWPWAAVTPNGTSHLIEPVAQVAISEAFGDLPPNEDSTRNELDQGNLIALSRFAGEDVVETGTRAAFGVTWTGLGINGHSATLSFGRIFRNQEEEAFSRSSGLDGKQSDWLIAGTYAAPNGFRFFANTLIDEDTGPTRGSSLISWQNDRVALNAAYIWQNNDLTENRPDTVSEWTVDGTFDLNPAWSASLDARYDLAQDEPVRAGLGLQWRNECVTVDVSASRRFASSTIVEPITTFSISGTISGFSAGRSDSGPAAQCRN